MRCCGSIEATSVGWIEKNGASKAETFPAKKLPVLTFVYNFINGYELLHVSLQKKAFKLTASILSGSG